MDIIDGLTYINGELLEENYLAETPNAETQLHFEVPEDSYFMMGDNRNHSYDSRYWDEHFVPKSCILSHVVAHFSF